jgi:cytochrome c2
MSKNGAVANSENSERKVMKQCKQCATVSKRGMAPATVDYTGRSATEHYQSHALSETRDAKIQLWQRCVYFKHVEYGDRA